jgi:uncharacterized membrane protein YfcA
MHLDLALVSGLTAAVGHHRHANSALLALAGLLGGFAVGLTGMGGGALMTPALVLVFKIDPKVAVASDLVNSLIMKPLGGAVHTRRGTVQWPLVRWLVLGSVPSAFTGAFLLNQIGDGNQGKIKLLLGWALLVASLAIAAKAVLTGRAKQRRTSGEQANEQPHTIKPVSTVLVGAVGGLIVGMTSVGSGSLMIVLLMLLYPRLASKSLVGTDLVQAIPLVASAALGQLLFGHINFGLVGALVVGSIPGVYLGARLSSRAPDAIVRPVLVAILLATALALLIPSNYTALGAALIFAAVAGIPLWGAVDATLRRHADWESVGRSRTRWVAVQGIGAPFGVGLLASILYFARVRGEVERAQGLRDAVV